MGTQVCVPGAGLELPGSELSLIRAGMAATGPQEPILAWVAAVYHMGQRPEKLRRSCGRKLRAAMGNSDAQ